MKKITTVSIVTVCILLGVWLLLYESVQAPSDSVVPIVSSE